MPTVKAFDGLKIMMKNGLFRRLVIAFTLSTMGLSILMPLNAFYVVSVLEAPENYIPILMFFNAIIGTFAIPLWVKISDRDRQASRLGSGPV